MRISWTQLELHSDDPAAIASLKRSSNSLAVVGDDAYVFGGELTPRVPVDDVLWVVGLKDGNVRAASHTGTRPSPRVGSSLTYDSTTHSLLLWGGREGEEMTPCDGKLWMYDLGKQEWRSIGVEGEDVEDRSYHVLVAAEGSVFLHAGCPSKGRLGDLNVLPIANIASAASSTPSWTTVAQAPGPGRGGTVLCPITLSSKSLLVRYGGFAGYEVGGSLDIYDVQKRSWTSVTLPGREGDPGYPMARSVHALVPVGSHVRTKEGKEVLAIMAFGERGPAPDHLGHLGAGAFHDDAWALVQDEAEVSEGNKYGLVFEELEQGEGVPIARGWFGANSMDEGIVVQGGLMDSNERLGDVWVGRLEV